MAASTAQPARKPRKGRRRPDTLRAASGWVRGLGKLFARVALFEIEGTIARVRSTKGMPRGLVGESLSLLDQTPLRWAVEAASPIVGAGRGPGGVIIPATLGLATPRAFAVVPLVVDRRLLALAYVDNGRQPFPVGVVAELFAHCAKTLAGQAPAPGPPARVPVRSTARRPGVSQARQPKLELVRRAPEDFDADPGLPPDAEGFAALEPPSQMDSASDLEQPTELPAELPAELRRLARGLLAPLVPPPALIAPAPARDPAPAPPARPTPVADPFVQDGGLDAAVEALAAAIAAEPPLCDDFELIDAPDPPDLADLDDEPSFAAPATHSRDAIAPDALRSAAVRSDPLLQRYEDYDDGICFAAAPPPAVWRSRLDQVPPVREELDLCFDDPPPEHAELVITPRGIVSADGVPPQKRRLQLNRRTVVMTIASTLTAALLALIPMTPPAGRQGSRTVEVPAESTVSEIADQLADAGFIRSPWVFRLLARLSGVDRDLRAGSYTLPSGAWVWSVIAELHRGQVHTKTITIPEGYTLREVAALLEKRGLTSSARFIKAAHDRSVLAEFGIEGATAEGYTFPETYTFAVGLSEYDILRTMLEQFFTRLRDIPGARDLTGAALRQRVTLASLVEREAKEPGERKRIAGVFRNRVERDMRLESCATVQYILQNPKAHLRLADLRIESPYNTYLNEGLPPGPIASPGVGSLTAAIRPEDHEFLFFVAREDGSSRHIFTKSFVAHQAAQKKIRRRR